MPSRLAAAALLLAVAVAVTAAAAPAAAALERSAYCGENPAAPGPSVVPALGRSDVRLVQSQVVIRHGDRTVAGKTTCWPADHAKLNCTPSHLSRPGNQPGRQDEPVSRLFRKRYAEVAMGNCDWGELTNTGFEQQTIHGAMLRDAYTTGPSPLLPASSPSAAQVLIHSDDVPRTVLSVESLYNGMYPNASAASGEAEIVDIFTTEVDRSVMFPNSGLCPMLAKQTAEAEASPAYQEFLKYKARPVLDELSRALGENVTSIDRAGAVFDCLHVHNCHDLAIPGGVTQKLFDAFSSVVYQSQLMTFQYPNATEAGRLNMGPLFAKLHQHYQRRLGGDDSAHRLVLFSGHDTTLMPLLAGLGAPAAAWTPYASLMAIELYEYVAAPGTFGARVLYNGEVVELPGCPSTNGLCDGAALGRVLASLVPSRAECPGVYTDF